MFGYDFVWWAWARLKYSSTDTSGPGKWVYFKTLYWERRQDGKKLYYADEAMQSDTPGKDEG